MGCGENKCHHTRSYCYDCSGVRTVRVRDLDVKDGSIGSFANLLEPGECVEQSWFDELTEEHVVIIRRL